MSSALLFAAASLLAYTNGANDNFKGVASLFGSDTASYRTALVWGTVATFVGSLTSIFLAEGLLDAFSGSGLVPDAVAGGEIFLLSVATGAGGTVLLATRFGLPISTTHSLVGGIVGAGFLAAGSELRIGALTSTFLIPLLVSPFVAVALAAALYGALHWLRLETGVEKGACVCLGEERAAEAAIAGTPATVMSRSISLPRMSVDSTARCEETYLGDFVGIQLQRIIDAAHFFSAGVVSFARGLNDAPKIAALLLVLRFVEVRGTLVIVAVSMAAGGLLGARRVAMTMGKKITTMNHGQGFAANLATGFLVIVASRFGVPVSTTHVSVGSLFGIGLVNRGASGAVVRNVFLSWVFTLPCAAALAGLTYGLASA